MISLLLMGLPPLACWLALGGAHKIGDPCPHLRTGNDSTTGPTNTFSGAPKVALESGQGQMRMLPSKAFNWRRRRRW